MTAKMVAVAEVEVAVVVASEHLLINPLIA